MEGADVDAGRTFQCPEVGRRLRGVDDHVGVERGRDGAVQAVEVHGDLVQPSVDLACSRRSEGDQPPTHPRGVTQRRCDLIRDQEGVRPEEVQHLGPVPALGDGGTASAGPAGTERVGPEEVELPDERDPGQLAEQTADQGGAGPAETGEVDDRDGRRDEPAVAVDVGTLAEHRGSGMGRHGPNVRPLVADRKGGFRVFSRASPRPHLVVVGCSSSSAGGFGGSRPNILSAISERNSVNALHALKKAKHAMNEY